VAALPGRAPAGDIGPRTSPVGGAVREALRGGAVRKDTCSRGTDRPGDVVWRRYGEACRLSTERDSSRTRPGGPGHSGPAKVERRAHVDHLSRTGRDHVRVRGRHGPRPRGAVVARAVADG